MARKSSANFFVINQINTDTPRIIESIKTITNHVQLLLSIGESPAIDELELRRCIHEAKREATQLRHHLTLLVGLRQEVKRAQIGNDYIAFAGSFRGAEKKICIEFDKFESVIRRLEQLVSDRMNDPGRWGGAELANPINEFFEFLFLLLDFWDKLRVRKKLDD